MALSTPLAGMPGLLSMISQRVAQPQVSVGAANPSIQPPPAGAPTLPTMPTMMPQLGGQYGGRFGPDHPMTQQIASLLSGTAGPGVAPGGSAGGAGGATPGILAAMGVQLQPGREIGSTPGISSAGIGSTAGGLLGSAIMPGVGTLLGSAAGGLLGNLFKTNNSPLQDIKQALERGLPVSDAAWARAGYGPGGTQLGA